MTNNVNCVKDSGTWTQILKVTSKELALIEHLRRIESGDMLVIIRNRQPVRIKERTENIELG